MDHSWPEKNFFSFFENDPQIDVKRILTRFLAMQTLNNNMN